MRHTAIITLHPAPLLDPAAQATARALGKVSHITGAGAWWVKGGPSFWDAWIDSDHLGGVLTLRLGRLELVADWRAAVAQGGL
jgi:hypothetical protein